MIVGISFLKYIPIFVDTKVKQCEQVLTIAFITSIFILVLKSGSGSRVLLKTKDMLQKGLEGIRGLFL